MKRLLVFVLLLTISMFSFSTTSCSSLVSVKILTDSPLAVGVEGMSYYVKFEAKDGISYKWYYSNFIPNKPEGLIFDENGSIFAAPASGTEGEYTFDVTVLSANATTARKNFALKIYSRVNITVYEFFTTAGSNFDEMLDAEGGSGIGYTWSADAEIPAWLNLNPDTGNLTGVVPDGINGTKIEFEVSARDTAHNPNIGKEIVKILVGPQVNFIQIPNEVFAGGMFPLQFDIFNPSSEDMTNLDGMMQFTSFGGATGDLDGEYNIIPDPSNPTEILAGETETYKFEIEVATHSTKAISTEPVTLLISATYDPNAQTIDFSIDFIVRVWEQLADMPEERRWGAVEYYDGNIYYFGGVDDLGAETNTIFKYEIANNTWTTLPITLPLAVLWNKAVTVGDKIYIVQGYNFGTGYYNRVVEFDPINVTCQEIGTLSTTMRVGPAVTSDGSDLFVFGRWGGRNIEKFDLLSNTASNLTAQTSGSSAMFPATFYNGNCYIFGGTPAGGAQYAGTTFIDKYDPETDTITPMAPLAAPVTGHTGALLNDAYWVIGGMNTPNATNLVQRYDFESDSTTLVGKYPFPVYCHSGCSDGNALYVMGGLNTDAGTNEKSLWALLFE